MCGSLLRSRWCGSGHVPSSASWSQQSLLCFADVEGEVVVLAPQCQFNYCISSLYADSSLLVIRPTTVLSSANLMMELVSCKVTQSWVNRENSRGPRTHTWGGPLLKGQCEGGVVANPHSLWSAHQDVQDPVAGGGVQTQNISPMFWHPSKRVNLQAKSLTKHKCVFCGGFQSWKQLVG